MKLKEGMVVRIKCMQARPRGWNYEGEMDEYVNQLVSIAIYEGDGYVRCSPLFPALRSQDWAFNSDNFVKANTIQPEIPSWAVEGKKRLAKLIASGDRYEENEDDEFVGVIDDLLDSENDAH